MAKVHGKNTVITLDGDDLSTYCNQSEIGSTADTHDVTTYGTEDPKPHVYEGGLIDGTASFGGFYDDTVSTGPSGVIRPLLGKKVTLVRQVKGEGSGLPQESVSVVVTGYTQTDPVADMVTFSCEMQQSGLVDTTAQA